MLSHLDLIRDPAFTWGNFAIGVIGSIVATVLTYFGTVTLKLRFPGPVAVLVWRRLKTDLQIVVSEIKATNDPNRESGRSFSMAPLGDTISFSYILGHLRLITRAMPNFSSVQLSADFDRIKTSNLLLIGGPKFNLASRLMLKRLDADLQFQFKRVVADALREEGSDLHLKQILNGRRGGQPYALEAGSDIEYGLVVICRNPFNPARLVTIAAGLNQISTLAAGHVLLEFSNWNALRYLLFNDGVEMVVRCLVTDNITASDIRVIAVSPIKLTHAHGYHQQRH